MGVIGISPMKWCAILAPGFSLSPPISLNQVFTEFLSAMFPGDYSRTFFFFAYFLLNVRSLVTFFYCILFWCFQSEIENPFLPCLLSWFPFLLRHTNVTLITPTFTICKALNRMHNDYYALIIFHWVSYPRQVIYFGSNSLSTVPCFSVLFITRRAFILTPLFIASL